MTDLLSWLRLQIDLHEEVARAATPGPWHRGIVYDNAADVHEANANRITSAYSEPCCSAEDALHIAYADPTFVLNVLATHREILDRHRPIDGLIFEPGGPGNGVQGRVCTVCSDVNDWMDHCGNAYPCPDVRSLARVHQDHPGFDPDWLKERS